MAKRSVFVSVLVCAVKGRLLSTTIESATDIMYYIILLGWVKVTFFYFLNLYGIWKSVMV